MNNTVEPSEEFQAASHHQGEEGFEAHGSAGRGLGWAGPVQWDLPLLNPCWPEDGLWRVTSLQRCTGEHALRSSWMLQQTLTAAVIRKEDVSLL